MRLFQFSVLSLISLFFTSPVHAEKENSVKCPKWIANLSDGTVRKAKGNHKCFKNLEQALTQGFIIPGTNVSTEPEPTSKTILTGVGNGSSRTIRLTRFPVLLSWKYNCPNPEFGIGVRLKVQNLKTGQSACLDALCVATTEPLKTRLITDKISDPLRITAEASAQNCTWEVTFEEGVK